MKDSNQFRDSSVGSAAGHGSLKWCDGCMNQRPCLLRPSGVIVKGKNLPIYLCRWCRGVASRKSKVDTLPCLMPCPKCGTEDIHRRFFLAGTKWNRDLGGNRTHRDNEFVRVSEYQGTALKDCISHHCRCCAWDWETAPLNEANAELRDRSGSGTPTTPKPIK